MTEETKDKNSPNRQNEEATSGQPKPRPPAEPTTIDRSQDQANKGQAAPSQGRAPRPSQRPPMPDNQHNQSGQSNRPTTGQHSQGQPHRQNPAPGQGNQQTNGQPQGYRPTNRPPQRPNDTQSQQQRPQQGHQPGPAQPPQQGQHQAGPAQSQQQGQRQLGSAPSPKQGQAQQKPPIDWLRSRPVPSGSRPPTASRGLDLGRPDAWSGRQKPPTPGTGQAPVRPQGGDRRPTGQGGTSQSQQGAQTYRPSRPSTPYQGRTPGNGTAPGTRPGGSGPRPGGLGIRPGAPTAPGWGKETETSRRARSARKGIKEKDREKPLLEEDLDEKARRRPEADVNRGKVAAGVARPGVVKPPLMKGKLEAVAPEAGKAIVVPPRVTVKELADILGISSVEIIKELMKSGIMAPINQTIDFETAAIVASDLGFEIRQAEAPEAAVAAPVAVAPEPLPTRLPIVEDDPSKLRPRPPVVTIMGHVDHGKTTLLDAIRRTNVAAGEYGGITQHIGAYQVEEKDQKITFLDTPGHEAFTAMRARGAQVTDIAVVVVAADDGVQPQTLEAINHARAAGVPIIVALNKIDKEDANPERVKQQLADAGLVPEEWGGNTIVVPVSAKKGTGVSDLLDMILLVAEIAQLKANPDRPAVGTIIEAEMDKTKGPMATVLVQQGTLNVGDYVVVGSIYGKIRAMFNDKGKAIRKATPSTPVSILGLSDVPQSGDILEVMPSERAARELAEQRMDKQQREAAAAAAPTMDLENLSKLIAAGAVKELDIVLKADVQGSLEPIVNSLSKLRDEKENVEVHVLHQATGMITENDVSLAAAARAAGGSKAAMVIGFNVEADAAAKRTAEMQGIEIRTFKVIYDLIDTVEKALKGLYEPKYQEVIDGHAEVRQIFKLSKGLTIGGSIVSDGTLTRGAQVRVRRNGSVVFEGKIASLRRFKDDVRDVSAGLECGITLDGFNDLQEGDIIEAYHKERMN